MQDSSDQNEGGRLADSEAHPGGDREELRKLLSAKAFVTADDGFELRDRAGASAPWLYYGAEVILTARGVNLMASVLLDRLATFQATQIATYGISAIPLVAACLAHGRERYTGLVVRKERKQYGVIRTMDGPVDRRSPVVVVDDSVSSGDTLYRAICALEAEGLRVEGAVCLIEFAGYGAREWLTARGYRLETVYDVWRDLDRRAVRDIPPPQAVAPWATDRLEAGLSPATAARQVGEHLLRTGRLLLPPSAFDRTYEATGGTFVSVRRRVDDVRLVRAGFRRDIDTADPRNDLVLAAGEAVRTAGLSTAADLADVKFAVSFLGDPHAIAPGQIDDRSHALVVRGLDSLDRIGFALPNSPHYDDAVEQYRYARTISGRFGQIEQHALYRQSVERICEPDATWPPYGVPPAAADWTRAPELEHGIARFVRAILRQQLGLPSPDHPVPAVGGPIFGVGVSLYADGLAGCALSPSGDLGTALRDATAAAVDDERHRRDPRSIPYDDFTVVVTLLLHRRPLGTLSAERLRLFYRLGRDTLQVTGEGRQGAVFAHFAAQQSIGQLAYQQQVLRKAGLSTETAQWTAYESVGWVVGPADRVRRLDLGYPVRAESGDTGPAPVRDTARAIANYIVGQRAADGLPAYQWLPWTSSGTTAGTAIRVLLALTGLLEAAPVLGSELTAMACSMVECFVDGDEVRIPRTELTWDSGADAQLLTCLCLMGRRDEHRGVATRLMRRLRALARDDGTIHAGAVRMNADLDLLSGSVLFALARSASWLPGALEGIDLATTLSFYRKRFRLCHPWGMVWWHGQAWNALADRDEDFGRFAFELVDWALDRQSLGNGAFVVHNMQPERSSFLTACVLEAVADAWARADSIGDHTRAERYKNSWERGAAFVDLLTIRDDEMYFSAQPAAGVGGVRAILPSSELRIDMAGHALIALAKGLRAGL